MNEIDKLAQELAPHYSHFNVSNRLLFTGHSHQCWPDTALEGLKESFHTAASRVDTKWEVAFEKAEVLRSYLREYYDDPDGNYCLGPNTHQLLVSWLSSFNLKENSKVVTTDAEFHSMHRQLSRLGEEGLMVETVPADADSLTEEINRACDNETVAIMLSRIYFRSGIINHELQDIAELARTRGIPLLIDDYHGTNVVPLSLREQGLEDCYILVGGYKYLQWGEGNCFLRFPDSCDLRPAITGWFASFNTLDEPRRSGPVRYDDGDQRFASGTYDAASQFRAARVVDFFREHGLTPERLHQQYQDQVGMLRSLFLEREFDPDTIRLYHRLGPESNGGFLALRSPHARRLQSMLMEREVFTDARGEVLRIGPAPYITSEQIREVMNILARCIEHID